MTNEMPLLNADDAIKQMRKNTERMMKKFAEDYPAMLNSAKTQLASLLTGDTREAVIEHVDDLMDSPHQFAVALSALEQLQDFITDELDEDGASILTQEQEKDRAALRKLCSQMVRLLVKSNFIVEPKNP